MTKMAGIPIYGKNSSKIFFSRTSGPISTKLGMKHGGLLSTKVWSNDDPGLTLTYFNGKVNLCNIGFSVGKSEERGFF